MTSPPRMWRTTIGLVTAILGAIAGANLVLIPLDMARARSTDNRISADTATDTPAPSSKPEAPAGAARSLIGVPTEVNPDAEPADRW